MTLMRSSLDTADSTNICMLNKPAKRKQRTPSKRTLLKKKTAKKVKNDPQMYVAEAEWAQDSNKHRNMPSPVDWGNDLRLKRQTRLIQLAAEEEDMEAIDIGIEGIGESNLETKMMVKDPLFSPPSSLDSPLNEESPFLLLNQQQCKPYLDEERHATASTTNATAPTGSAAMVVSNKDSEEDISKNKTTTSINMSDFLNIDTATTSNTTFSHIPEIPRFPINRYRQNGTFDLSQTITPRHSVNPLKRVAIWSGKADETLI